MNAGLERMWRALRKSFAGYQVIHEQQQLLNRPWEEDFLHFACDGQLHGHLLPPRDGRRRSVTSDGWCPDCGRPDVQQRGSG